MSLFRKDAEVETLRTTVKEHEDTIQLLREESESYKQTIATFPGVKQGYDADITKIKAEYEKKLSALTKEYDTKVSGLVKEKEAVEKSVNKRINTELASMGISTAHIPLEDNIIAGVSPQEAVAKLNSLSGAEQREFYTKHKALLDKAVRQ